MNYQFRKAHDSEIDVIWEMLQHGIARRKADGSGQWQDGYPNVGLVQSDLEKGGGFVLTDGNKLVGYTAALINDEPVYADITGKWLTNDDFVVVHRVIVSPEYLGKGIAKIILKHVETYARENNIFSIKADTNFDNPAMLKTFENSGYILCGEVYFRGNPRKAYEKVLAKEVEI